MQDYKQLAKQKELEIEVADLNKAREQVLQELKLLESTFGKDRIVQGGRVDQETLEIELKEIAVYQQKTNEELLKQQIDDILSQAKEGSRYIALKRKLRNDSHSLNEQKMGQFQESQAVYQKKQLEVFDYLEKNFAQFEVTELEVSLPDAGKKFFTQVVAEMTQKMRNLVKSGRDLQSLLGQEIKKMEKLKRQEQRMLEKIHQEVGKNLADDDIGSPALVVNNREYQNLLQELEQTQIFKTSLLNQLNNLIDLGIEQLESLHESLKSIVSQNQATREILSQLKKLDGVWDKDRLEQQVNAALDEFDEQVSLVLRHEINVRYDDGELDEARKRDFVSLVDEILDFQDYLGKIMVDSWQVISTNLDDLIDDRAEYGRSILDFLSLSKML